MLKPIKCVVLAFAAVAALAAPSAANAISLRCSAPTVYAGNADPGPNPVVSASVWLDSGIGGTWRVEYQLADGQLATRRDQYPNMTDVSAAGSFAWVGNYRDDPNLRMIGEILRDKTGAYSYREHILDDANGGRVTVDMTAECSRLDEEAPVDAIREAPAPPGASVPSTPSTVATIELRCSAPAVLVGQEATRPEYHVVRTDVFHSVNAHSWEIHHYLSGGSVVSRGVQYELLDTSNDGRAQWTGTLNRNPNLRMIGELQNRNGNIYYDEWLYDKAQSGKVVFSASSACQRTDAAQTEVAETRETAVPIVSDSGTFEVPVTINDRLTLNFVVDSGAADVSIPADVVLTLVRTGTVAEADFLGEQTYKMADGSPVPSRQFLIRSMKVGDKTLANVVGSIAPVAGSLLLGQSFLNRFKSWSLDNQRRALILNY
jgi:predicted aspartyl protease